MYRVTALPLIALLACAQAMASETWIRVESRESTVSVVRGGRVLLRLGNASFGRGGVSRFRLRGSDQTPLGEFRIVEVKHDSRYHRFFRIDYPTFEHTGWAQSSGVIDIETYFSIVDAIKERRLPPQDTVLGGYLGIHGIGDGDPAVHARFNWTNGCVALTNEQIDLLTPWARVGTRVVIK